MKILEFPGQGPRTGRVHVFDKETGAYITRGFLRGSILYVKREVDARCVVLNMFEGRRAAGLGSCETTLGVGATAPARRPGGRSRGAARG